MLNKYFIAQIAEKTSILHWKKRQNRNIGLPFFRWNQIKISRLAQTEPNYVSLLFTYGTQQVISWWGSYFRFNHLSCVSASFTYTASICTRVNTQQGYLWKGPCAKKPIIFFPKGPCFLKLQAFLCKGIGKCCCIPNSYKNFLQKAHDVYQPEISLTKCVFSSPHLSFVVGNSIVQFFKICQRNWLQNQ